jgi:hypothetical protein
MGKHDRRAGEGRSDFGRVGARRLITALESCGLRRGLPRELRRFRFRQLRSSMKGWPRRSRMSVGPGGGPAALPLPTVGGFWRPSCFWTPSSTKFRAGTREYASHRGEGCRGSPRNRFRCPGAKGEPQKPTPLRGGEDRPSSLIEWRPRAAVWTSKGWI